MFSIPHGRANAILLPDVILFNQSCALERYKRLSMLVGTDTPEGLAQCVEKLRANVNIESNFKDAGISENAWLDNIPVMAERALNDACTFSNPLSHL
ncbi:iron-containing alcohol dehydrogenase [Enterobacter kobei]|uniref:iron-containing alcohol dehydrogenase n=1 Tax=Enterobacter kobei TaxID=208224 RepID=UPI0019D22F5C